jgi:hypothetical protein
VLLQGVKAEEVDLKKALELLSYPRELVSVPGVIFRYLADLPDIFFARESIL